MILFIRKICSCFCNWCECYKFGVSFSDTRFGSFIYRNLHDFELWITS